MNHAKQDLQPIAALAIRAAAGLEAARLRAGMDRAEVAP